MLVSLDFPHSEEVKAKVPNPDRNKELQLKYGVQGFPTVLLMTADGEVFAQTGYKGMSPEDYLADVREMSAKGKKALSDAKALMSEYESAKDKAAVVRKAIAALDAAGEGSGPSAKLGQVVRNGLTLDPENKAGLKLASLTCLVINGQAARGEMDLALEMDPRNELGLMEAVVSSEYQSISDEDGMKSFLAHAQTLYDLGTVHKSERVAMVFAVAAYMYNQEQGNQTKAKPFAAKALELGGLPEYVVPIMQEITGKQG